MLGKTEKNPQLNLTETPLIHFINPGHELCRLAKNVNWDQVEKDFAVFYSDKGAPSVPIRIIVGLIMLKQMYHCSDKGALSHWLENPYWQHFCGEVHFQHKAPFYYSDFSHFRKRIGKEGEKKIMQLGVDVFGHVYIKGTDGQGKKSYHGKRGNILSRAANNLGNYLIKVSSH
jgi:transposase, IS5 family